MLKLILQINLTITISIIFSSSIYAFPSTFNGNHAEIIESNYKASLIISDDNSEILYNELFPISKTTAHQKIDQMQIIPVAWEILQLEEDQIDNHELFYRQISTNVREGDIFKCYQSQLLVVGEKHSLLKKHNNAEIIDLSGDMINNFLSTTDFYNIAAYVTKYFCINKNM